MTGTSPPPGWYPAPDTPGLQRWWDGAQWTPAASPGTTPPTGPVRRTWPWIAAGAVMLLVALIAAGAWALRGGDDPVHEVAALLPEGHVERGRQALPGAHGELLILSHPAQTRHVTVSLLRMGEGVPSLVDRRDLRCSVDEELTDPGGARLRSGHGRVYVTCSGHLDTLIDPEAERDTRVWVLEPGDTQLLVHPDGEQGWPTVGFVVAAGDDGDELLIPHCTDLNCAEDQYAYAVHVARDAASGTFQAVACSEPGGPRTEMPGGPWDASANPQLQPPSPERSCGAARFAPSPPQLSDIEAIVEEICDVLRELDASDPGSPAELTLLADLDELLFHALAASSPLGLFAEDLRELVGSSCPPLRGLLDTVY